MNPHVLAALLAAGLLACREEPREQRPAGGGDAAAARTEAPDGAAAGGAPGEPSQERRGAADAPADGSAAAHAPPSRQALAIQSFAPLVRSVQDTVVHVEVVGRTGRPRTQQRDPFFGGPRPGPPDGGFRRGSGSGVIVDPSGLVVTNNHVVEGATRIRVHVWLDPGEVLEADVLGRDPLTDLALLRLRSPPENLPSARLGDSGRLRVGDWVVAIGSPFGLTASVSAGIISGEGRDIRLGPYDDFLQTDAAINPGNSGGPLFDLSGEVVGIATAIVGGGTGIGFAIPSAMVKALLPQLEGGAEIERGFLGVSVQDLTPALAEAMGVQASGGAIVGGVEPRGPAARAGLRTDDVIVAMDGEPIESARALTRRVGFADPGDEVELTVHRGGEPREVEVKLGRRSAPEPTPRRSEPAEGVDEGVGLTVTAVGPRLAAQLGIPPRGALVTSVLPGSPADEAGLAPGMVVIEAGGEPVRSPRDLALRLGEAGAGGTLLLRVQVEDGRFLRALQLPR